jgi:PIN domain nuclease of toxin-antitoxin system
VDLLLDTHAFLWWLANEGRLGSNARAAIANPANVVFISAASAWEIAVKRASGKLRAPGDIASWITASAFRELPITVDHAIVSAELPRHHSDPFDRMLVAQALVEKLALVAHDNEIDKYGVRVLDACA